MDTYCTRSNYLNFKLLTTYYLLPITYYLSSQIHRVRKQLTYRMVTNSSAELGCIPTVASKSALVAPIFTAIATP